MWALCGRVLPAMPHLHADSHLCVGMPCPRRTDTRVVSTASCTPPNKGNPSAITSILLPSRWFSTPKSRSLTRTLVLTRPPPSRQMRAAALSTAKPRRPNTPVVAHADRWWPRTSERRYGHTGTRMQTDEVEAGGDATGEPGKLRSRTVSRGWLGRKQKALLREDPLGRAPSLALTR